MGNQVRFKKRFNQPLLFEGLDHGNLYPTDIDAVLEYKNKGYLFFEVKGKDKELSTGQKLALERLVNDTGENKLSIAVVVEHNVSDPEEEIKLKDCIVKWVYSSMEGGIKRKFEDKIYTVEEFYPTAIQEIEKYKGKGVRYGSF